MSSCAPVWTGINSLLACVLMTNLSLPTLHSPDTLRQVLNAVVPGLSLPIPSDRNSAQPSLN